MQAFFVPNIALSESAKVYQISSLPRFQLSHCGKIYRILGGTSSPLETKGFTPKAMFKFGHKYFKNNTHSSQRRVAVARARSRASAAENPVLHVE